MRCDVFGASGHVTIKPSICKRDTFYKLGVYAMKVKCLTPGGLYCVEGATDMKAIACDRSTEVSRRHSTEISGRPERLKREAFYWRDRTALGLCPLGQIGETITGFRNELNNVNNFLGSMPA